MRFIFILSLISIRSSSIQSKDIINAETYFPFPDFSLLFTVKLSYTDITLSFFSCSTPTFAWDSPSSEIIYICSYKDSVSYTDP